MKIVFVNRYFSPDQSATSQILSDLAFFLAGQRWDVHVVTSRQKYDDPQAQLPAREICQGVKVRRVWTSDFGRSRLIGRTFDYITFYLATAWALVTTLRAGDVVVAKTDPPLISIVAAIAVKFRGAKLVNWWQDVFPETAVALGVIGMRLGSQLTRLRDHSLRAAERNVAIGVQMRQLLIRHGADNNATVVIHNWCNDEVISPLSPDANPLRVEWEFTGKFIVGYSGNLGRAHDFATILDAAERLSTNPRVVFLFVGDGYHWRHVVQQSALRGLANIVFKPPQQRAKLQFSLTIPDVHLISLRPELEGLIVPSKFYGIAAAGRPTILIGDADGEIGTIVTQSKCGVVVRPGDGAALASVVETLMSNAEGRARMGHNARSLLDAKYGRAIAFDNWAALLEGLARS